MNPETPATRVAIVGAGPIGLEAALSARTAGLEPVVFEQGQVADSVRRWGHVRLFSPFSVNRSRLGRDTIAQAGHGTLPGDDALLTGSEFAERYLIPLSQCAPLTGRIREHTKVVSIARRRLHKRDSIGSSERAKDGFEILIERNGRQSLEPADYVLDCSGTYPHHRWIGAGGQRCPGETDCLSPRDYQLADISGTESVRFSGRRTLVVGSGFSAATAITAFGELMDANPDTSVVWLTRTSGHEPMSRSPDDPLPERDRVAARANSLVTAGRVDWRTAVLIREIQRTDDAYRVELESADGQRTTEAFDAIVAHPGYRPDNSLFEELQVHQCYASEGPMRLAAVLLGADALDCLVQPDTCADMLANPEPCFFVLGSKSYGRSSHFLLSAGIRQVQQVIASIVSTGDAP